MALQAPPPTICKHVTFSRSKYQPRGDDKLCPSGINMERAVAKVTFEGIEAGGDTSASETEAGGSSGSEEERETRLMVTRQNKKGKKSGGFQSMGGW